MSKPEGYPLPWCEALDAPYWQLNLRLIALRPGWSDWQKSRPMSEIIPEIDVLIETARLNTLSTKEMSTAARLTDQHGDVA